MPEKKRMDQKEENGVHDKTHYLIVLKELKPLLREGTKAIPQTSSGNPDFVTDSQSTLSHRLAKYFVTNQTRKVS